MAQLVVRNLEDVVEARLRVLAVKHGRSMEEEVRAILRAAVGAPAPQSGGPGREIAACFKGFGLRDGEEIPELRSHFVTPWIFDDC
nr:plasmid stabilization protein [uncultured Rhodopila sp.]